MQITKSEEKIQKAINNLQLSINEACNLKVNSNPISGKVDFLEDFAFKQLGIEPLKPPALVIQQPLQDLPLVLPSLEDER